MRILFKKILILISLLLCAFSYQEKTIHIYHDKASTPTILQMINFIQQPEEDYKIVLWERIKHNIQNKEQYKNTYFALKEDDVIYQVKEILKKHVNVKIVLHYNSHHSGVAQRVFGLFSSAKFEEEHIYEDASQYMWRTDAHDKIIQERPIGEKILYMWGNIDDFCNNKNPHKRCGFIKNIQNEVTIKTVDFHEIKKSLTDEQKREIFTLHGFDYIYYQNILLQKQSAIYVLSCTPKENFQSLQLAALKDVCQKYPDYQWFYKHHPNKLARPKTIVLKALCPNIKEITPHIPFELLNILDEDLKVAGMGSSLFFNQNKENILTYIQRGKVADYLDNLKRINFVTKDNLYTYETILQKIQDLKIIVATKEKQHFELIELNKNVFTDIFTGLKYSVLKRKKSFLKLKEQKTGKIFNLTHKETFNWELKEN